MIFGLLDYLKLGAGAIAGAALALAVAYPIAHHKGFVEGKAAMVVAVEKRNVEAGKTAQEASSAVDRCYDAGGTWDQGEGKCDK